MAKGSKVQRRMALLRRHRRTPYPLPSCGRDVCRDLYPKKCKKGLDKKDWEDATCTVCMEFPHNAVLLLCSSHDKGCRPYMCGTSFRHSNCLDQYKKAYTKVVSSNNGESLLDSANNPIVFPDSNWSVEKCEVTELACPLCRGLVKGWTVVEPAREYLNTKRRSCMQDSCSFVGNYKELKKHVRVEHPSARPREVDPQCEQRWRRLEWEREREDVISTVTSTMPGAMIFGDYVIEGNHTHFDTDEEDESFDADAPERNGGFQVGFERDLMNVFLLLHAFRSSGTDHNRRMRPDAAIHRASDHSTAGVHHTTPVGVLSHSSDEDDHNDGYSNRDDDGSMSLVSRLRRHGRELLGRSARRRRRREANAGR